MSAREPQLEALLRSLKLPGMADMLGERLAQARSSKLGHAELLALLCGDEIARRDAAGLARRLPRPGSKPPARSRISTSATTPRHPVGLVSAVPEPRHRRIHLGQDREHCAPRHHARHVLPATTATGRNGKGLVMPTSEMPTGISSRNENRCARPGCQNPVPRKPTRPATALLHPGLPDGCAPRSTPRPQGTADRRDRPRLHQQPRRPRRTRIARPATPRPTTQVVIAVGLGRPLPNTSRHKSATSSTRRQWLHDTNPVEHQRRARELRQ
jgi:hypothetical protein